MTLQTVIGCVRSCTIVSLGQENIFDKPMMRRFGRYDAAAETAQQTKEAAKDRAAKG